ncbi:MAG: fumarylacetoacetate hydrolase family protein [Acidimicrobiia bacterium]
MRLTTIRIDGGTTAARIEGDDLVRLPYPDLVALLGQPDWHVQARADGPRSAFVTEDLAPAVRPPKVICVGLNYRTHILEMGRDLPEYPTLFAKYPDALTGARDDLVIPKVSDQVDWEVELGVVIGTPARRVDEGDALDHVAGYTVVNDISMRDWQRRTSEFLQGKTFESSTPVGPVVVSPDELDHALDLALRCEVDGEVMQDARTSDLIFGTAALVSYISQFTTLQPGDLIATGTPGGVGAGRDPQVFLRAGQTVTTTIEGIGSCINQVVAEV